MLVKFPTLLSDVQSGE